MVERDYRVQGFETEMNIVDAFNMKLAIIIGCPRSGTSILGELIEQHPSVAYRFEAMDCTKFMKGIDESHKYRISEGNVSLVRGWYIGIYENGKVFVHKDALPTLNVTLMRKALPWAKFIHVVRDGRDVACSLIPGLTEKGWCHAKPPSWKRIEKEYSGAMRGAHAWKEIVEIALSELGLDKIPHALVKYETLVSKPIKTANGVLAYLGLSESENVTRFCDKIQNKFEGSYHADYQDGWYREKYAHSVRIGRWRENLNREEQKEINALLGPLLKRLGYRL